MRLLLFLPLCWRIMKQKLDGLNSPFSCKHLQSKQLRLQTIHRVIVGLLQRTTCELCWCTPFAKHEVLAVGHVVHNTWGLIGNAQSWLLTQKFQSWSLHFNKILSWFLSAMRNTEPEHRGCVHQHSLPSPLLSAEEGAFWEQLVHQVTDDQFMPQKINSWAARQYPMHSSLNEKQMVFVKDRPNDFQWELSLAPGSLWPVRGNLRNRPRSHIAGWVTGGVMYSSWEHQSHFLREGRGD